MMRNEQEVKGCRKVPEALAAKSQWAATPRRGGLPGRQQGGGAAGGPEPQERVCPHHGQEEILLVAIPMFWAQNNCAL
ncbi:hypothetical protein VZT92_022987 [Zoarces viviparus]|uniref:Uncharacterized protein n=1 Tax=Zoarces viviparus TaxID=48416 RepID=A0AAW1E760_ZOAVI